MDAPPLTNLPSISQPISTPLASPAGYDKGSNESSHINVNQSNDIVTVPGVLGLETVTGRVNEYVRMRGELKDGDAAFGRRGSGTVEVVELGQRRWFLRFKNLRIKNDFNHPLALYLLWRKAKKSNLSKSEVDGYLMSGVSKKKTKLIKTYIIQSHESPVTEFTIPLDDETCEDDERFGKCPSIGC